MKQKFLVGLLTLKAGQCLYSRLLVITLVHPSLASNLTGCSVSRLNTWLSLEHTRLHQHPPPPLTVSPTAFICFVASVTVRTLLSSLPITTSHTCLPVKCRVHCLSCVSEEVHTRRGSERCYSI